ESFKQALNEILGRKRAAMREANLTYFVKCSEVGSFDNFHARIFPLAEEAKKYYGIALTKDCAGFECDKDGASVLRKLFTTTLELPTEEPIEEQIRIPSEEVSIEKSQLFLAKLLNR
ncbi:MAG: hypothetical protein QXR38_03515, partial [Nitrososphaerales archaeon]